MKTSFIFLFVVIFTFSGFSKTKIIIQSKDDIRQITITDIKTGKKQSVSTWNKTGGGFLLEVDDIANTKIGTEKSSIFRLFNIESKMATKWIEISKTKQLSIKECFDKHFDKKMESSEILASASSFIMSNFINDPVYDDALALRGNDDKLIFKETNKKEYCKSEDVNIQWDTKYKINKITLTDLNDAIVIWESKTASTTLKLAEVNKDLKKQLQIGHQYQVNIVLENPVDKKLDGEKYSFEFFLKPIVFEGNSDITYFLAKDSMNIEWQSIESISNAKIISVKESKVLWENTDKINDKITYSQIKATLKEELIPGTQYRFEITSKESKKTYGLIFQIVLSDKELNDLIQFIGK